MHTITATVIHHVTKKSVYFFYILLLKQYIVTIVTMYCSVIVIFLYYTNCFHSYDGCKKTMISTAIVYYCDWPQYQENTLVLNSIMNSSLIYYW